jgi:hypothetical protein
MKSESHLDNSAYFDIWCKRWRPFAADPDLAVTFSPAYFARVRQELEANGYKVFPPRDDDQHGVWLSPPIGYFMVDHRLPGESFVLQHIDMGNEFIRGE